MAMAIFVEHHRDVYGDIIDEVMGPTPISQPFFHPNYIWMNDFGVAIENVSPTTKQFM